MELTPRMKNWIEQLGVHVAVATAKGFPTVIVADKCTVEKDTIYVPLSSKQKEQIASVVAENGYVAVGPGQLGVVRAPYQFKGNAKIAHDELVISVDKIYCTRPGAEAGLRLDIMSFDVMKQFEESRWKDINPPTK